ncbi:NADPH-dependent oxidoreductase [Candidatus Uhrbacteria bacterium]|nr:NADPH-dependent oxidoreductase [Candidatus Uhrbacteria bacterium]
MSYFIPILLGTSREGRFSEKAATYIEKLLRARGVETQLVDPRAMESEISHEKIEADDWCGTMEKADALIIVTPEYNHGYPGVLKDILDSAEEECFRKPVAICGCSSGGLGGARVVEQLRQVMIELRMPPIREAVYFSDHKNLWNEDGSIKDPGYENRVNKMLDELLWYTQILKQGRETLPFPA